MAAENALAIVIRTVPFGDTSAVLTLFTREFGKLRALAKGAWRPKGAFDAALDLLSVCQVLVLRKTSGGLDLLTEARLENRFRVGASLVAFHGGMHVAELLDVLTADADPQPELFDLAEKTLQELSFRGPSSAPSDDRIRMLVVRTELEMLRITGHAPSLDRCAECAGTLPATGRIPFGMLDGGALCERCRRGKRTVVSVSSNAMAALRALAGSADSWRTLAASDATTAEIRALMNACLAHLVGRRLKLASLLAPTPRPRTPHQA
ncbi:MAG: DNA repair protein RecO [Planctomycetia bacterium]|nr:DNA repair protein RecO [Planctomycetia bacterium]